MVELGRPLSFACCSNLYDDLAMCLSWKVQRVPFNNSLYQVLSFLTDGFRE